MNTTEKLDKLSEMKAQLDELKKAWEEANAELISSIETLETEIKDEVLESGETVKGESLMAVWNSGKTTWDGKILKGLEVVYPEIGKAKKVGNPTVSFRKVAL